MTDDNKNPTPQPGNDTPAPPAKETGNVETGDAVPGKPIEQSLGQAGTKGPQDADLFRDSTTIGNGTTVEIPNVKPVAVDSGPRGDIAVSLKGAEHGAATVPHGSTVGEALKAMGIENGHTLMLRNKGAAVKLTDPLLATTNLEATATEAQPKADLTATRKASGG